MGEVTAIRRQCESSLGRIGDGAGRIGRVSNDAQCRCKEVPAASWSPSVQASNGGSWNIERLVAVLLADNGIHAIARPWEVGLICPLALHKLLATGDGGRVTDEEQTAVTLIRDGLRAVGRLSRIEVWSLGNSAAQQAMAPGFGHPQ